MKFLVTSENSAQTPNTSFRESPCFHVLASRTYPHYFCSHPPASLNIHQLASLDKLTSCLVSIPSAFLPLLLSPPWVLASRPVLIHPIWLLAERPHDAVQTHKHNHPQSQCTLNTSQDTSVSAHQYRRS